ncbi:MAG TPA: hypothetical protein VMT39_02995 [Candidatus Bathyarchaeia archaeon]|nr:hypothetical protein [Candidatus Bathyarchaeia archaeon]
MHRTKIVLVAAFLLVAAFAKDSAPPPVTPSGLPDGAQAYKTNCTRCHSAPPALSPRQAHVVMRHMRVRANLPARDAEAVLRYLLESEGSH